MVALPRTAWDTLSVTLVSGTAVNYLQVLRDSLSNVGMFSQSLDENTYFFAPEFVEYTPFRSPYQGADERHNQQLHRFFNYGLPDILLHNLASITILGE